MVINMVAIIDYDAGNIKSVEKALHYLGEEAVITRDRDTILGADRVILPGVGAFGDAMEKLRTYELDKVIQEVVAKIHHSLEYVWAYSFYLNPAKRVKA